MLLDNSTLFLFIANSNGNISGPDFEQVNKETDNIDDAGISHVDHAMEDFKTICLIRQILDKYFRLNISLVTNILDFIKREKRFSSKNVKYDE